MNEEDEEFAARCESYAETCRLQLVDLKGEVVPAKVNNASAQMPTFEANLIPISDGPKSSMYRHAVYSSSAKMLMALGMDHSEHDSTIDVLDTKSVCNMALQHVLKESKDSRVTYSQEFEGLLVDKLISKYDVMKSFVDDVCQTKK